MTEQLAMVRFPKGTRVRMTGQGTMRVLRTIRPAAGPLGVVVGYSPRDPWGKIAVVCDGRKTRVLYSTDDWEPMPAEVVRGS